MPRKPGLLRASSAHVLLEQQSERATSNGLVTCKSASSGTGQQRVGGVTAHWLLIRRPDRPSLIKGPIMACLMRRTQGKDIKRRVTGVQLNTANKCVYIRNIIVLQKATQKPIS